MSYVRPDHDAADASWEGAPAYTRPDHDAADASWASGAPAVEVAIVGLMPMVGSVELVHAAVVSIAGHMPYAGAVVLEHSVGVTIAGAMPYTGEVLLEHTVALELSIDGLMPYAGAVELEHLPPVAVAIMGAMPYLGDVELGHYPLVQVSVDGAMPFTATVQLRHQAPRPVTYSSETSPEYVYVAHITYTTDGDDLQHLYVCTGEGFVTRPSDDPPNTHIAPTLLEPGWLKREMSSGAQLLGATRASYGQAQLNNLDGRYDNLDAYGFDGRSYTLYVGEPGAAFPDAYTVVFEALMGGRLVGTHTVDLTLLGHEALLDKPIASTSFEGTGGVEGPEALAGQPMPRYYGLSLAGSTSGTYVGGYTLPPVEQLPPPAVPLVLIDPLKLIYLVCENPTAPLANEKWNLALDGGMPYDHEAPYATVEDLLDDVQAPGPGAARFFHGGPTYVRLGTQPVYAPSALPGNAYAMDGGFPDFEHIAEAELGLEISDYSEYAAFAGYYARGETYLQAMSDCAVPQQIFFGFTRDAKFFARELREPTDSDPVYAFGVDNVVRGSLRRITPVTAPLPITRVDFRGVRNHMHGQTLAPAVFEEDYPDYFDPGTTVIGPVADVRVIAVLHWLQKEYATDKALLPPPPPPPPPPPEPQVQISGRHPYLGSVVLSHTVGITIAGLMPYVGEIELTHGEPVEPEVTIAGVMPFEGSISLEVDDGLTAVFRDEFDGTAATMAVHTPDETAYGLGWTDGFPPMSVSGGRAQVAPTYLAGLATLVTDSSPSGLPIGSLVISWTWRSPSSFETFGARLFSLRLQGDDLGNYGLVSIFQTYDAETEAWEWTLRFPAQGDETTVTITASTDYDGTLVVEPSGAMQLEFVGESLSGSVGSLVGIDLEAVELELRADSSMGYLTIEVPDA